MKIKTTWKMSTTQLSLFTLCKLKFSKVGFICLLFLLLCTGNSYAETIYLQDPVKITGKVTDSKGVSLPNATVFEKGTKNAVTTDFDGSFTITVSSPQAILVFKYIGMKDTERPLNNATTINVQMADETNDLQTVVVVGYGTMKKASVVGAISSVKPSLLQVGTSRTLGNNLAGQVTGIMAVQRSGEPGYDQSDIKIRGISTFAGGQNPLVLVDGIERNLNDLDPSEIESFSVLKDAAAGAVYGVRGANGVILINTKRGFVGTPKIQVRTEFSIQEPTKLPKFIGAAPYMSLLNELAVDSGKVEPYSADRIAKTANKYDPDLYPDVNWVDEITKDYAYTSRTNLNIAGGSEILRYALTASYYSEKGMLAADPKLSYDTETRLNRANIRSNVDVNLSKTTLFRLNIGGFLQNLNKGNSSTDDLFNTAFETTPFAHPAVYSDGTFPKVINRPNPWAMSTQQGFYKLSGSKIESLASLEQDFKSITPGLKAKFTYAFDSFSENKVERGKSPNYYDVATKRDLDGSLIHSIQSYGQDYLGFNKDYEHDYFGNKRIYLEANVSYSHAFGKHDVTGLLLYNQDSYDDGTPPQAFKHQGLAGRASYTFDRKYVGEVNFGYNGSENFAKGQRYGFFPSVSMGWIASEEKFMESLKDVFNKIKLRGSYGLAGNDNIGGNRRFAYQTTISDNNNSDYNWGTGQGVKYEGIEEGEIGVTNLTWEKVAKTDIGLELGILNTIDLTVDVFQDKRKDILIRRNTVPTQAGFINAPFANIGKMENKGFEVALNFNKQITPDFFMSWRANFTFVENKVTEKDEADTVKGTYRSATGISHNTLYGYIATGLYTKEDFVSDNVLAPGIAIPQFGVAVRPGDIKYEDRNSDGKIDGLDQGFIGGTTDPQIVYGFGNTSKYKQFDFSFFFQGIAKSERIIGGSTFIPGSGEGTLGNIYGNYQDRWTEENPNQDVFYPRLSYGPNINNALPSTWWKKDMSFGRLKSMEFGYSLKKNTAEKMRLQGLRVYVSGNNLWYISNFKLWDPELDTSNGLKYPSTKSVLFGLDISL
ncbi:TonB-dependent receptor [Flavobacterium sp. 5]|uniref:SusC/RagA family TonB-linked outer membrane protein n=1 Tax=Flavobacterium sp. 5 TaxID=2035199 RepID=UPI000CBEC4E7|nr:TonB-dependent receptor [Flavobacterium sp. 5]PKB15141.1 TonB-linked SusC/RagA family outer membrane protein [Flavobacterium sp. 5]